MNITPPIAAFAALLKYGLVPDYWNEYVFQAYAGHTDTAVYLSGIPDRPDTLPCFDPDSCADLSRVRTLAEKASALKKTRRKLKKRR